MSFYSARHMIPLAGADAPAWPPEVAPVFQVAGSDRVRVELLRCRAETIVRWRTPPRALSLVWVRSEDGAARVRVTGSGDSATAEPAGFWLFPEGSEARGEMTGDGPYECGGVFVAAGFLPLAARPALVRPIAGGVDRTLGRAFDALARELAAPDALLPLVADGWALQTLAQVVRAARRPRRQTVNGLAPWQLRRATAMLREHLAENLPVPEVAAACKLSASHFGRAFRQSMGVTPHQWVIGLRVKAACALLARSATPMAEVALVCGFADQSHFCRTFGRVMGVSPGGWREREGVGCQ